MYRTSKLVYINKTVTALIRPENMSVRRSALLWSDFRYHDKTCKERLGEIIGMSKLSPKQLNKIDSKSVICDIESIKNLFIRFFRDDDMEDVIIHKAESQLGYEPEHMIHTKSKHATVYNQKCPTWPRCMDDGCKFIHPEKQCTNFPFCKEGKDCKYIHPKCLAIECENHSCPYVH